MGVLGGLLKYTFLGFGEMGHEPRNHYLYPHLQRAKVHGCRNTIWVPFPSWSWLCEAGFWWSHNNMIIQLDSSSSQWGCILGGGFCQQTQLRHYPNCLILNSLESGPQFSSVTRLCPTLCDPTDCNTPGFPVHHQLPELTQTHVYWVGDTIQPSHLLSSPSLPTVNLSQHQGLFKWVSSLHQVTKVLEFQLQHQSFQWVFRTDFL